MNILSKIYRLMIIGVLSISLLNARCRSDNEEVVGIPQLLMFLYAEEETKQKNRALYEPNNDFSSARCANDGFESYVYPKDDIDFYTFTLLSGSFKLYISSPETLGNQKNLGIQIYDDQSVLIYDLNQRSFDGTNSTILVNRNMSQSECTIATCTGLDKYRYMEFSPTKLKYYIKIYSLRQDIYFEGQQLNSVSMNSFYNPTNLKNPVPVFLQGNFATCP